MNGYRIPENISENEMKQIEHLKKMKEVEIVFDEACPEATFEELKIAVEQRKVRLGKTAI